jgi:molecular chaperone GrpE
LIEDNEMNETEELERAEQIQALERVLAEEKERAENYLANWQRTQADFANYRKRAEQEKRETTEFASSAVIMNLLTVVDDFERAFASLPDELAESSWIEGIKMIYNKFKASLEAQGLTEIKAKGEPFDPHFHDAVMGQEGEEGMVIDEVQKGYMFKDRVIRPSMVVVGKGGGGKDRRRTRHG